MKNLQKEEVLRDFLDQFFFNFLWEEFGQEVKCDGRVFRNLLVQDLGGWGGGFISVHFTEQQ